MAFAMNGAAIFENPEGVLLFRSVIRVYPSSTASHVYCLSIENGPSGVRMTSRA